MKRIWHPYWQWEDLDMWRNVKGVGREEMLHRAEAVQVAAVAYRLVLAICGRNQSFYDRSGLK